jgi:uncharacterized protein (TIGR02117 family)
VRAILLAALALLAGCAGAPVPRYQGSAPRDETLYLIDGGWHTKIALARAAMRDLPARLTGRFPGARYLVFGWGARDYYRAADPGLGDALRALVPGPAVVLVMPLAMPPAERFGAGQVLALPVSRPGLARLAEFLARSIAWDKDGAPQRVGVGPAPGSLFYAATARYDAAHTCNGWTAEALWSAGLPVSPGGVVFAGQLLRQASPLARAAP